jgi:hypothetical protein
LQEILSERFAVVPRENEDFGPGQQGTNPLGCFDAIDQRQRVLEHSNIRLSFDHLTDDVFAIRNFGNDFPVGSRLEDSARTTSWSSSYSLFPRMPAALVDRSANRATHHHPGKPRKTKEVHELGGGQILRVWKKKSHRTGMPVSEGDPPALISYRLAIGRLGALGRTNGAPNDTLVASYLSFASLVSILGKRSRVFRTDSEATLTSYHPRPISLSSTSYLPVLRSPGLPYKHQAFSPMPVLRLVS